MKKIIGLIAVVALLVAGFFGFQYWNSTYNGVEAYAKVPQATKQESKNNDGSPYKVNGKQYYFYDYEFTWVTKDGQTRKVGFESAESADPKPLAPGSYVKAQVSQKRVVKGPSSAEKQAIPADVQAKLDESTSKKTNHLCQSRIYADTRAVDGGFVFFD